MHGTPSPTEGAPPSRFARSLAILLALDAVMVLSMTPRLTLWQIDEGRIAEVSREMALTGDLVTPRLGGIPFACYPPLPYWLMAASGGAFGWTEFAMRLPGALFGIGLVGVIAVLTRRFAGDRAGLLAGLVLATLPGFVVQEKMCRADVTTMFFATLAFERFLAWAESPPEQRRRRDLLLMYVSISLGVLAKGPIAIAMLGVGGLAWFILKKEWNLLGRMGFAWGIPLAAAIVVPWYILVYRTAGPDFLRENLLWENVRAFTDGYQQKQKWHFYLKHAPPVLLPWLLALALSWKVRRTPGLGLALAWFAGVFLFLSTSAAKRTSYVAYMDPPLAMAAGITLAAVLRDAPRLLKGWLSAMAGLLVAAGGVFALVPTSKWTAERMQAIADLLPLLGAATGGAALVLAGLTWLRGPGPALPVLAAVCAAGILVSGHLLEPRGEHDRLEARAFCRRVARAVPPDTRIAVLDAGQVDGALHFYMGRPLPALSGEPGYYVVADWQRDLLRTRGRKFREIDAVRDTRFIQVTE
jgi:4-amino-4-deoxy-L-arabinose transferase-like glycosyltransferase